ncbi:outer membrane autotransporter barrel domain-containing protein [Enterobacter ludwigii]|nr:outer membrane autotransporter barrel domain-containing protein [Enterobacter ludwigii]
MVRPEAATYADNLRAANAMFVMGLRDRQGETRYTDAVTGETHPTSMWMRNVGGRNKSSMSDGQNKTAANRYVMQLGGNIMSWNDDAAGQLSLGVMGGYANQKSNTKNSLTGNRSTGSVSGYSAGLYGTWYQDAKSKAGMYVDSWLQYAWFNNEVKGQDLAPETYKSKGLMASAETGYNLRLISWLSGKDMANSLWLQPRAQVIWTGVKVDDHTEYNGTRVHGSGSDNVQTRLGLRTYLNGKSVKDKDTVRTFQPFVEADWVYNTKQAGVSMNGSSDNITGSHNVGEMKAGVEGKLTNNLSLWTDVAQQMGGNGYSDTQGTLGVKYDF